MEALKTPDAVTDAEAARRAIHNYTAVVFNPSDVVEVRRVRPGDNGHSTWHDAAALVDAADSLIRQNGEGWNIYVGANPRDAKGRKGDDAVPLARCIFCDFDK